MAAQVWLGDELRTTKDTEDEAVSVAAALAPLEALRRNPRPARVVVDGEETRTFEPRKGRIR